MKKFFIALLMLGALHSNGAFGANVSKLREQFEKPKVETKKPAVQPVAAKAAVAAVKPEAESKKAQAAPQAQVRPAAVAARREVEHKVLAAPRGAVAAAGEGCSEELELTRKALEDAHGLLSSIFAQLEVPAILFGLKQQDAKEMRDKINEKLDSLFWTRADADLKEAWAFLQKEIYGHTPFFPEEANPWEGWDEREWAKKESIISSERPGQGTIWEINPEFGDFLTTYMQDYDKLKKYGKRMILISNVGVVVPSLYAHGPMLSKKTLQDSIVQVASVAPATAKILQAKLNQRLGQ